LAIGGFEAPADKHGELAGWTVDAAAKASCTLDSAVKRSGAKSLRYDLVKAVNPQLHATFETRAGRTCRLGLWLRCDGVLAALDANGRVPQAGWAASSVRVALDQPPYWHAWNQFHPAYWPGGSTGLWQRVEFDLPRAPSDGPVRLSLELHLGVCQAGTVWVDDVDLREVE
jgi:hypothetical protein